MVSTSLRCVWLWRLLLAALLPLLGAGALAEQPLTPLSPPVAAPEFELEQYEGDPMRLTDHRGVPVIVSFWATWCPPCREELPSMNRAWRKIREQGVMMLAVNVAEDDETIFAFLAEYPIEFPVLMDTDGKTVGSWPVKGLPTTFVLDPDGNMVYRAIGGRDWDDDELLEKVLALRR